MLDYTGQTGMAVLESDYGPVLVTVDGGYVIVSSSGEVLESSEFKHGRPIVDVVRGDFDGDGVDDLLFFAAGEQFFDIIWTNLTVKMFSRVPYEYSYMLTTFYPDVNSGVVKVLDYDSDGVDEILLTGPMMGHLVKYGPGGSVSVSGAWPVYDAIVIDPLEGNYSAYTLKRSVRRVSAVGDVDGDGSDELILADESGRVYAVEVDGSFLWSASMNGWANSMSLIKRLGKESTLLIAGDGFIAALDARTGWVNWLLRVAGEFGVYMLVADFDADGRLEAVVLLSSWRGTEALSIEVRSGRIEWRRDVASDLRAPMCACDLDGNLVPEVILGTASGLLVLDGRTGSPICAKKLGGRVTSILAYDLDSDGVAEVVASTGDTLHLLKASGGARGGGVFWQGFSSSLSFTNRREYAEGDADGDLLPDYFEPSINCSSNRADTDGDGVPDGYEAMNGMNPSRADSQKDGDGDGLTMLEEYRRGTRDTLTDSDGDGIPDGWDASPNSHVLYLLAFALLLLGVGILIAVAGTIGRLVILANASLPLVVFASAALGVAAPFAAVLPLTLMLMYGDCAVLGILTQRPRGAQKGQQSAPHRGRLAERLKAPKLEFGDLQTVLSWRAKWLAVPLIPTALILSGWTIPPLLATLPLLAYPAGLMTDATALLAFSLSLPLAGIALYSTLFLKLAADSYFLWKAGVLSADPATLLPAYPVDRKLYEVISRARSRDAVDRAGLREAKVPEVIVWYLEDIGAISEVSEGLYSFSEEVLVLRKLRPRLATL